MPDPRPITLTAAQVRAALAGGTVELRRPFVTIDWRINGKMGAHERQVFYQLDWRTAARLDDERHGTCWIVRHPESDLGQKLRPVFRPGDRLWVREAWATDAPDLKTLRAGLEDAMGPHIRTCGLYYDATAREFDRMSLRARPATTMPRWASRLTLVVTGLRLEPGEPRPFVVEARRDD